MKAGYYWATYENTFASGPRKMGREIVEVSTLFVNAGVVVLRTGIPDLYQVEDFSNYVGPLVEIDKGIVMNPSTDCL